MINITRVGLVTLLNVALVAGCSKSSAPTDASASTGGNGAAAQSEFANNPICQVASDFLDAVLKGDTQRGIARLTPKAIEQIVATGKKFDPPGVDSPSFKIVGVASSDADRAFVQCEFTFTAEGAAHSESMCCGLRLVNNEWRVFGIAYGTTPDKPWVLTDFETGRDTPVPLAPANASGNVAGTDNGASRPSPRTAQEVSPVSPPAAIR